ncbi:MAG: CehA/McbA family metallohydrolase, partial [Planctomycetota bacterium]
MTQPIGWKAIAITLGALLFSPIHLQAQDAKSENPSLKQLFDVLQQNKVYLFKNQTLSALHQTSEKKLIKLLKENQKLIQISIKDGRALTASHDRLVLPGDMGVVLLRIGNRSEKIKLVQKSYNFAERRDPIPVKLAAISTTWVALKLENVPAGKNSLIIELKKPSGKSLIAIVDVTAPQPAKLRINIISDDNGQPVPAMVKLLWNLDRSERRPSSVVDFSSQFDNLGRPDCQRHAKLPGKLSGHLWWCVPGPFDMPIPPGKWEIIIRRGVEHLPIFDSFNAKPGQTIDKTYTPRHWANMPRLGWYSGDDHVHCQITSDRDAERLMTWAQAEDVHLVNVVTMGDVYRTWFQQRGFGPQYRITNSDYVLVPGQECPRTHSGGFGHTLSINTTSYVRDVNKYWLYDWVADKVHDQGGLFGYAHALLTHPYIRRGMSLSLPRHKVDFAEILQYAEMGTDFFYDFLNMGFKLTASAGTDVPWQGTIGEVRMYAYLGQQPFSADAWFDAVKRGRTFVTNGPMIEFHVDNAMPGDEIILNKSRKLRIKARVWGHPQRMVPKKLQIVRHGETIKSI